MKTLSAIAVDFFTLGLRIVITSKSLFRSSGLVKTMEKWLAIEVVLL
jgi:hypothetical protein